MFPPILVVLSLSVTASQTAAVKISWLDAMTWSRRPATLGTHLWTLRSKFIYRSVDVQWLVFSDRWPIQWRKWGKWWKMGMMVKIVDGIRFSQDFQYFSGTTQRKSGAQQLPQMLGSTRHPDMDIWSPAAESNAVPTKKWDMVGVHGISFSQYIYNGILIWINRII